MLSVTINGHRYEGAPGTTILAACRQIGIEIPSLCHDDRLQPTGACRVCVVDVKGWLRHATACNTVLEQGMEIETHSPAVEQARATLLELLALHYPADAIAKSPDKEFHRWLRHYHVRPGTEKSAGDQSPKPDGQPGLFRDASHPYLHVDMGRCITCFRCVRICDEVQGQFAWRVWHRGEASRILPDSGSTLLSSSCVSCGACVDTCPTGALEDQSVLEHGPAERWTRTTCPYCGTGCEMNVGTRQDRIVQIKPVLDAPVSKGHLCAKGRYAFGFVEAPDRVTEPMIREHGVWRKVSWEEAIAFTAGALRRIRDTFGPDSVGMLSSARGTNEENYLAQKVARVVLGTNNVDCCARVCHAPTAAGMKQSLGTGAATNSFDDIECARTILICGCNPTENHPIVGARIKQAARRGAHLIVIDPRRIELADRAELHLAPRPGTNVPLLNAMARVILEEGLADPASIEQRATGLDAFRAGVLEWTPERAGGLCGVDANDIRQAARLYARETPAMCFHGLGMTEHVQGTDGVVCLVNLALITGNLGKPGSGVNPLRGQNNVQGAAHMGCEPGHLTGYTPLNQGRAAFEQVWHAPVPAGPGLNLMEMIDAAAAGRLKALWAIGYDVALTNPNATATRQALRSLELVIVQDLFLNELAKDCGTVFLPAASSFEKEGTFMNSERRVQRVRQALPARGQARSDWEILRDIAQAMGHADQFPYRSAEEIWDEVRSLWKAGAGLSYARLDYHGLQWPCPTEDHPGTSILHTESFPTGRKAPLHPVAYHPTQESPSAEFPFLLTTGRTLYQFNAGTMTRRTPNALLRQSDVLDIALADAARLGLETGDIVRVQSRYGAAELPTRLDPRVKPGELFATFHDADAFLNHVTSPHRDRHVQTPEYKVTAVALHKVR